MNQNKLISHTIKHDNNALRMNKDKKLIYDVVTWIRVPLMILVIFVHCPYEFYPQYDFNAPFLSESGIFTAIGKFTSIFAHCGVPCFFIISGYLFFRNINQFDSQQIFGKYKKRVPTLLVPYLFWNTIVFLWNFLISYRHENIGGLSQDCLYNIFIADKNTGTPAYLILWYVRNLIAMVLLSPLFLFLFKYTKWGIVLLMLCAYIVYDYHIRWLNALSLTYFVLGSWIGYAKFDLSFMNNVNKINICCWAVTFVLCILNTLDLLCPEIQRLLGLISVVSIFCIAFVLVNKGVRIYPVASASTFFVYCIHILQPASNCTIAGLSTYIMQHTVGYIPFIGPIISYLTAPLLTFCFCLYLFKIMTKFLPKFTGIITGARVC